MKLDARLVEEAFLSRFTRGRIIRFYMKCDDPKTPFKYKFGIILNKNSAEHEALLAITTTNVERYSLKYCAEDIVRLEANSYPCFDRVTIINLREVRIEAVGKLKELYQDGRLAFEGELSAADIADIDEKIRNSKLIATQLQKRIV